MSCVYFITDGFSPPETNYVKIGLSESPIDRLSQLQSSNPSYLFLDRMFSFKKRSIALGVEGLLHEHLKKFRIRGGEWFRYSENFDNKFSEIERFIGEDILYIQNERYSEVTTWRHADRILVYNDFFGCEDAKEEHRLYREEQCQKDLQI